MRWTDCTVSGVRGDNEVSGFGGHERGVHGFLVAHFSHGDYVGVLSQGVQKRLVESPDVGQHFLLDHDAAL